MIHHETQDDTGRCRYVYTINKTIPTFLYYFIVVLLLIGAYDFKHHHHLYPPNSFRGCHAFSIVVPKPYVSTLSSSSSSWGKSKHRIFSNSQKNNILYLSVQDSNVRDDELTKEESISDVYSTSPRRVIFADYMATCVPGMAHILAEELRMLGGQHIELSGTSAVYFRVDYHQPTIILTILLWCRTAHKIMELLCRTKEPIYTRTDVYEWIRNTIPTTDLLLNPNVNEHGKHTWFTLSVAVTLNNAKFIPSDINHSHYTALNIKNALVDAAREVCENDNLQHYEADRPSVDITESCDVPLMVMVRGIPSSSTTSFTTTSYNRNSYDREDAPPPSGGAHISLFRCIHGTGSLHRRGYRSNMQIHKAAMKESTAAALLYAAQWHSKCQKEHGAVLMDPMMGSGTLLVEGTMIAADIAPGLMRIKCGIPSAQSPPILRWKIDTEYDDHNHNNGVSGSVLESMQVIWNRLLIDATKRAQRGIESLRERNIYILGNDMNDRAYELANASFQQAGLRNVVQLDCTDCADWKPQVLSTVKSTKTNNDKENLSWMIVSNPPWGVRLSEDMEISWEALRSFLRSDSSVIPKTNDEKHLSEVWILSGNAESTKHLGLRRSQSIPLQTGEQNLRWLQYILRPPGTMNSTTDENGYQKKFESGNAQRSNKLPYDKHADNSFDNERRVRNRGYDNQSQMNSRPTTKPFRDRNVRVNSSSNRNAFSVGGDRRRQDTSYPEPQRQRREQPPKQRKVKTSAPPKDSDNEWLI